MSENKQKNTQNPTRRQHFVPEVFLKSFCYPQQNEFDCCILPSEQNHNKVLFKRSNPGLICWRDYLYELMDKDGVFIHANLIENFLSNIEKRFPEYKASTLSKIKQANTVKIENVLTDEEEGYWGVFMALQIVRLPETISNVESFVRKVCAPSSLSDIKNATLLSLFPVLPEYQGRTAFDIVVKHWVSYDYRFILLYNNTSLHFYTSDCPVVCEKNESNVPKELKSVPELPMLNGVLTETLYGDYYMPLTPRVALVLCSNNQMQLRAKNAIVACNKDDVKYVNEAVLSCAQKRVICDRFSEGEKEYIKDFYKNQPEKNKGA